MVLRWAASLVLSGSCRGLARFVTRLGERLADRYLEFVAGRCRADTLRAVAFDLKTFLPGDRERPGGGHLYWVVQTRQGSWLPRTSARRPRPVSSAGSPTRLCSKWPGTAWESRGLAFQVVGVITW
jgi:hypothetical protein